MLDMVQKGRHLNIRDTKLTKEAVEIIKFLQSNFSNMFSFAHMASAFGVHEVSITNIYYGKNWSHVKCPSKIPEILALSDSLKLEYSSGLSSRISCEFKEKEK